MGRSSSELNWIFRKAPIAATTPFAVAEAESFRLLWGESELTQYLFNMMKNVRYFCGRCGVRGFGEGNETPMVEMHGVNLGSLENESDEALAQIPVNYGE